MNWVELIGMTLIHFIWQGAALMLLALGLLFVLRRRSAQARYLACCLVLSGMAVAPLITSIVLAPSCRVVARSTPLADLRPIHHTTNIAKAIPPIEPEGLPVDEGILKLIVIGWTIGAGALAVRVCGGFFSLSRLKHSGHLPIPPEVLQRFNELVQRMKLRRIPRLYLSNLVSVPTVIGAFRGIVLLPASVVTKMSPEMLESILVHELAHVTRYDFLINALQSAIEVVLFYHPAVWWVSQRIREERENCCDDLVIATLSDRKTYARALTTLAELRGHSLAVRADGGELLVRVRRILGETPMKSIVSPLPVALLLGGLILVPALQSFANPPAAAFLQQKKAPTRASAERPKIMKRSAQLPVRRSADQKPATAVVARSADVARKSEPTIIATDKAVARQSVKPITSERPRVSNTIPPISSGGARMENASDSRMIPSANTDGGPAIRSYDRAATGEQKDAKYYRRMEVTIELDSLLENRKVIVDLQRSLEMDQLELDNKIMAYRRAYPRNDEAKAKVWEAQMDTLMAEGSDLQEKRTLLRQRLDENAARLEVLRKQLEAIN